MRVTPLGIGCLVWSAITFSGGMTNSLAMFAGLRVLFGCISSICYPNAIGLLRDYFPPKYRTTVNAVFGTSVYLGTSIASFSVLLIKKYGWREAHKITGVIGMILGVLCLTLMKEPQRGRYDLKTAVVPKRALPAREERKTKKDERSGFKQFLDACGEIFI